MEKHSVWLQFYPIRKQSLSLIKEETLLFCSKIYSVLTTYVEFLSCVSRQPFFIFDTIPAAATYYFVLFNNSPIRLHWTEENVSLNLKTMQQMLLYIR